MTLKRALWLMTSATRIALSLMFLGIIVYVTLLTKPEYIYVGASIMAIGGIILLSRKLLIRRLLNKVEYPGPLYSASDKSGMLTSMGFYPKQEVLDDLYEPFYPTDSFLADNGLSPIIYRIRKSAQTVSAVLAMLPIAIGAVLYFSNREILQVAVILSLYGIYLIPIFFNDQLRRMADKSIGALYTFSPEGLYTRYGLVPWKNVYDWEYVKGAQRGQLHIVLSLIEPLDGDKKVFFGVNEMAIVQTDFLLLLAHYKYKYGQVTEDVV
jgi:hypothetical protein